MEKYVISIYKKKFKKQDGSKFDKTFLILGDNHYETVLTEDVKKEIIKQDIEYPFTAEMTDDDHFVKMVRIESKKRGEYKKPIVFIRKLTNMQHYELTSTTLSDIQNGNNANAEQPPFIDDTKE